jgi:protein dithiol:quinone oxidoreductase
MSIRTIYFSGLVIVTAILMTSVYFQVIDGIMPCPLCTLQRISFFLLGFLFLAGIFLHAKRKANLIITTFSGIISLAGIFFAGRQVWLQYFPPLDNSECGVSLQYMMKVLPMNEVIRKIFSGSAECTQRGWELLYLNMAEWALVWFSIFFLITIYLFIKIFRNK